MNDGLNLELGYEQKTNKLVLRITLVVNHVECEIGKVMYHHENHVIAPVTINEITIMAYIRVK